MIIFKDVITNDEMFSDTYKMKDDGVVYEVDGKLISEKVGVDSSLLGANPSEGGGEGGDDDLASSAVEDGVVSGCNIVIANRLALTQFTKDTYRSYIKTYMKNLKLKLEEKGKTKEQIKEFQDAAQAYVKMVLDNFTKFDFYTGSSTDPDGMVALLNYKEDGVTPFMLFFKHGLEGEKF